jgi:hypothetical protein
MISIKKNKNFEEAAWEDLDRGTGLDLIAKLLWRVA